MEIITNYASEIKEFVDNGTVLQAKAQKGKRQYQYKIKNKNEIDFKVKDIEKITKQIIKLLDNYSGLEYIDSHRKYESDEIRIIISWEV